LALDVEASCIPVGTTFSGLCWYVLGKKCCIKILITSSEW
jgi:hypothetical protein